MEIIFSVKSTTIKIQSETMQDAFEALSLILKEEEYKISKKEFQSHCKHEWADYADHFECDLCGAISIGLHNI